MRKFIIILGIVSLSLLSACSFSKAPSKSEIYDTTIEILEDDYLKDELNNEYDAYFSEEDLTDIEENGDNKYTVTGKVFFEDYDDVLYYEVKFYFDPDGGYTYEWVVDE